MPATPDDLFAFLDRLQIPHPTVTHAPLFTVEQSLALAGRVPGGHSKNLFLKDTRGALYLIVLLEDARVNLKALPGLRDCVGLSFGETSWALAGRVPGGHSKRLFLKDTRGALYLIVLPEGARVNLKALPGLLDCGRLSFGSADLLRATLGVEPGSVTPFALIND